MSTSRIISIAALIISIIFACYLGNSIYSSIIKTERISIMEVDVIKKLTMIRKAQESYQSVNGQYTSDWDKLINFIDSGEFYITSRIEHVFTLAYGADSVFVEIDTLGTKSVKDSIFSADKYPDFDLSRLAYVPGRGEAKFGMWADKIDKNGVLVDVVEVWNTAPIDPAKKESNKSRIKKPLRFGSKTSITTSGNWE